MYVIAVYDVEAKRTAKMLKLCRRYLHWIQNSVFEGEITEVKLKELIHHSKDIMKGQDSFIIFKNNQVRWMDKEVVGHLRAKTDQYL